MGFYAPAEIVRCAREWRDYLGGSLLPEFMQHAATSAAASAPAAGTPPLVFSFVGNATGGAPGEVSAGFRQLRPVILKAAGYFGDRGLRVRSGAAAPLHS